MLFRPTLKINRLVAKLNGKPVYDERFHVGLNILSGRNGGGKTSVIQLLMYGLGYEIKNWRDEAKSCDSIFVEIEINGQSPLTLRRLNSDKEKQGMDICFKPYEDAILTQIEEWKNYPYSINQSRESFSQKIFSLLGMPEIRVDDNNNVTLHQVFRLLYSDQSNPASCIFNVEQFDSAFKREAIGRYLMGLYDNNLYDQKILLSQKEKELDKVLANLSAVYSVIGKTSYPKELPTLKQQKENLATQINELTKRIQNLKSSEIISYPGERAVTENFASENVKIKSSLLECEEELQGLAYEIHDSEDFIGELKSKLSSINESIRTEKVFRAIAFEVCPACLARIEEHGDNCCDLCGSDDAKKNREVNIMRMKNEIEIQIRESERILKQKKEVLKSLEARRKETRSELRKNITKVSINVSSLNSASDKDYYLLYKQIGECEEKIENLDKMGELHKALEQLSESRSSLQSEVNELSDLIKLSEHSKKVRDIEVNSLVANQLIDFVRQDIGTEETFRDASQVDFDFAANRISVNSKTSFAESTAVYLNNAFHLALLFASLEKEYIRLPRLMILDGIENGGMEDARSQNFQMVVANKISSSKTECQVILATKSIHPSLNNKNYVVGSTFTENKKSLSI
ncbi:AAA family ATPase [Chromobacterium subtsugae]|uniref:AAA family ATPase n=1 Tax=Chromobacterium subtsugae TaxID=251747 RepID=UPI0006412B10|nr:AAA family ATPase [Chromobacterium subtsugae]